MRAGARTEAVERVTRLLKKHVALMDERGLTFEHTFRAPRLRFTVALARYGAKGREFVEVDSTGLDCDCAALRPRDEPGAVIHDPDAAAKQHAVAAAVRRPRQQAQHEGGATRGGAGRVARRRVLARR